MGSGETWSVLPSLRSVSASISRRISSKSWKRLPGRCANSPHSLASPPSVLCSSCSSSGRRVHMPAPRGRKSRPTRLSSTDDLPLLWLPTTTICGSAGTWPSLPSEAMASCSLLKTGRRRSCEVQ